MSENSSPFCFPPLGPRLVFFTGGTALRDLSRQLIHYTHNSVHLVTPFDSGGSSAALRRSFAMPAVGDIRNRLLALAGRDNVAGGSVTFGRAFLVGILITLVTSTCYVATWELIYFKITPDFSDKYAAYAMDKAKKAGASPEKIAAQQKEFEEFKQMYQNPLINSAITFLEPLPVGIVFTLVSAILLSRKRRSGALAG